jgi:hypothetical protein
VVRDAVHPGAVAGSAPEIRREGVEAGR